MKKLKEQTKKLLDIFIRYLILVAIAIPGIYIFYLIFTPLTVYPSYFLFNLFFETSLKGNIITVKSFPIEIIQACIAGAAYYLLLILILSTRNIKLNKRIKIISLSFSLLLLLNILRIFFLGILYISESAFFDISHKLFLYSGSTLFVVLIWFLQVWLFKIKEVPFYSDLIFLYRQSSLYKYKIKIKKSK